MKSIDVKYFRPNPRSLSSEGQLICAVILSGINEKDTRYLKSKECESHCDLVGIEYKSLVGKISDPDFLNSRECKICMETRRITEFLYFKNSVARIRKPKRSKICRYCCEKKVALGFNAYKTVSYLFNEEINHE